MPETDRIEYKQTLTDDLEKEVVAFLNASGGKLYIGLKDDGTVLGLSDADGLALKIKDRLKNNISPGIMGLFTITNEEREEHQILVISIASGTEKPYYIRKYGMSVRGCYHRVGTAAEPMDQPMIDVLYASRTRNSLANMVANRQDLSFSQLKIYYEGAGTPLNNQFARSLELKTENGKFNYNGYLLADENNVSVKVAKYKNLDRSDLIENNEFGFESLVKVAKQVLDKIAVENQIVSHITASGRTDKPRWNAIALREAVINAFVHNDYTNEVPPKFEFFSDRLEITTHGGLPHGINKDEFFDGLSVPRNRELMRVFKDLGMVEQLGSGIPRILQYYGRECFQFSENFLRMIFPAPELTPHDTPQVTPQVT
ncbi:MAG: RNA-binding domain-containing protein, partial [Balneola sp.]